MIVKMIPAFKDNLWGGTRLKDEYGKDFKGDILAESWEFSTHPNGISYIEEVDGKRQSFPDFLTRLSKSTAYGGDPVGKNWGAEFPLLVKFIDSKKSLSLQVHPNDEIAKEFGEKFGKTEMWHILEAKPGSYLYVGFSEDASPDLLKKSIENNQIEDLLNKVEVRPGENYYIESGTLHAIGPDITLLEIQQKSNLTFRVSDFGRRDKNGKLRELHIPQALRSTNYKKTKLPSREDRKKDLTKPLFSEKNIQVDGKQEIFLPDQSFLGLVVAKGSGTLTDGQDHWEVKKGQSYFVPRSNPSLQVKGDLDLVCFSL